MTSEDLQRMEFELRPIPVDDGCSPEAGRAARRFNTEAAGARSQVAAAKELLASGKRPSADAEMQLRAAAVQWSNERTRVIERYRLRS